MSSNIVIKVENLSKCYHIYDKPRDRLLQIIFGEDKKLYKEFWALSDVSFEVKKGEVVGIIGRNGSGKSTLLQMICGTLNPTTGNIQVNGRVAALLELGSGFNPEFTGRENVYMNASVLGLSNEEIDAKLDSILDFADIGIFIDQPLKTYSTGMVVRLAFAVQAQIDPDILIVDEALSVGDAKFQAKCFERLRQLKEAGASILLVTHSSEQIVTHCSRALLLDAGQMIEVGDPRKIVNRYMDLLFGKEKKIIDDSQAIVKISEVEDIDKPNIDLSYSEDIFSTHPGYNSHEYRWGDGSATILDYHIAADCQAHPQSFITGQSISMTIAIKFNAQVVRPIFGVTIKTKEGVTVYGVNSETLDSKDFQELGNANMVAIVDLNFNCHLAPGDYFISLGIASRHGAEIIPHDRRYDSIHLHIMPNETFFGIADLRMQLNSQKVS